MEGIDQEWLSKAGTSLSNITYAWQLLMNKDQNQIIENNFRKKHEINLLLLVSQLLKIELKLKSILLLNKYRKMNHLF